MRFWMMAMAALVATPVWAAPRIEVIRQDLQQGGFLMGRVPAGSAVEWRGEAVPQVVQGEDSVFVIGFDRKEAAKGWLKACDAAGACDVKTLEIAPRTYKVQQVKGVPAKTVNPDPKQLARMKDDSKAINAARTVVTDGLAGFVQPFVQPAKGPVTGVYGSSRSYNGEERSWHKGGDFAAKTGTPVVAPADGVVVLAKDTFMNGNLIVLDHGGRLYSAYAHLDSMGVKKGQKVARGERIGAVGNTGRSTGPHLHWGMYWKNMAIDPMLWLR